MSKQGEGNESEGVASQQRKVGWEEVMCMFHVGPAQGSHHPPFSRKGTA